MKKYNGLIALLLIVLLSGSGIAQETGTSDRQFPLLGWYGIPAEHTTEEKYGELAASGLNINFPHLPNADAMEKALDIAHKTGVKMIVSCPELVTETEKTVRRFMNHPAVLGYYLRDEPNVKDFADLGRRAKVIRSIDKKHFCYVNLFPTYANETLLGVKTYREYVQRSIKEIDTKLVTFDHYPVMGDTVRVIREDWYENLEIISDEATKASIPFWAFALTVAHDPYPIPTLAELRLQVYSNLAYGAQGIQYFTYWTPVSDQWNFHRGPITVEGKRTEVYDRMKQVNGEIKSLTSVFLDAKVLSVGHTGSSIPKGTKRLSTLPKPIKALDTNGGTALVSVLKNAKKSYLVVVNKDFKKPLRITIDTDPTVKRLLKDGSLVSVATYMKTMEVDPGDVAIYAWN